MARQNINIGSSANDGTGDTLRAAGNKINETFIELYQAIAGDSNTVSSQITIQDSAIVFEGTSNDAFETFLRASDVVTDVNITLPDSDGIVLTDVGTQTLTNKTLDSCVLLNTIINGNFMDSNYRPLLSFETTHNNNLNNYVEIKNAPNGSSAQITVDGTNTNSNLELHGKGAGGVLVDKLITDYTQAGDGQTPSNGYGLVRINPSSSGFEINISDVTNLGEIKTIINTGSQAATINLTIADPGYTGFTLPAYTGVQMVWYSAWVIVSNKSSITLTS